MFAYFLTNPKYVLSIKAKMHVKLHCGKPLQCCRAQSDSEGTMCILKILFKMLGYVDKLQV